MDLVVFFVATIVIIGTILHVIRMNRDMRRDQEELNRLREEWRSFVRMRDHR